MNETITINLPIGTTREDIFSLVCNAHNYEQNNIRDVEELTITSGSVFPELYTVVQVETDGDENIISTSIIKQEIISEDDFAMSIFGKHSAKFLQDCINIIRTKSTADKIKEFTEALESGDDFAMSIDPYSGTVE